MAIAHVGTSTTASGTGTSATTSYTPQQAGNLVVASVRIASTSPVLTTQAGWTRLTLNTTNVTFALYWRIAAGETTENPVQWVTSVGWGMVVDEYTLVPTVSPVDVENCVNTGVLTPLTTPTVTPSSGVERLVLCGVCAGNTVTYTSDQVNASATGVASRGSVVGVHTWDLVVPLTSGTYQGRTTPSATGTQETGAIALFAAGPIRNDERRILQAVQRAAFR